MGLQPLRKENRLNVDREEVGGGTRRRAFLGKSFWSLGRPNVDVLCNALSLLL